MTGATDLRDIDLDRDRDLDRALVRPAVGFAVLMYVETMSTIKILNFSIFEYSLTLLHFTVNLSVDRVAESPDVLRNSAL